MIVGLKTWPHDEHKQLIATAGWSWVDEHTLSYRRSPKKATVRSPASPSINLVPTATDDALANIRGIMDPIQSRAVSSRIRRNSCGISLEAASPVKFARYFGRTCRTTEREISHRTSPPLPPRSLANVQAQ